MKNYSYFHLPEGYELYQEVRLEKDRKALLFMMIGQILLVLVMVFLGVFYCSPQAIFSQEVHRVVFRFIAMLAGIFVYILAHEWVHGLFIRLFSGKPAAFGFRRGMAFASSEAYFGKIPYIIIALAPLAVWGILLGVLTGDAEPENFWFLYIIQIVNVTGAVGDLYMSFITAKMPKDVLIIDHGTSMEFFLPEAEAVIGETR